MAFVSDTDDSKTSFWLNPTDRVLTLKAFQGPGSFEILTWQPGETKELSTKWDNVIHQKYNGVIVGGLGPHLVRVGEPAPVHSSLIKEGADGGLAPKPAPVASSASSVEPKVDEAKSDQKTPVKTSGGRG